jgi:prolyl-tRNA editing enzyme YbaK/EbsC (Cys-tRNA(Pro) deacylase)
MAIARSRPRIARQIGAKSVQRKPEVAQRHSGYMVGGTSPFGTKENAGLSRRRY